MILNKENYYSSEANKRFMSVSQFKDFYKCEALAMAKLDGFDEYKDNTALLVGNYVHSYFESEEAHREFCEQNQSAIMTLRGTKRAEFKKADEMIDRLAKDDFFNFVYQGEKEHIVTGFLNDVHWKARIDCLNVDKGYFVDIKTTGQANKRFWSDKYQTMVSFVEKYDYVLQMAVYKHLLEQEFDKPFTPYIMAVTKESPVNIKAINFDESRFLFEYDLVEELLPRFIDVKNKEEDPVMCGKCKFCIENKPLTGFVEVEELIHG